jgi:hypothetical protein
MVLHLTQNRDQFGIPSLPKLVICANIKNWRKGENDTGSVTVHDPKGEYFWKTGQLSYQGKVKS